MTEWIEELPALVALSDAEAADAINAMTVEELLPISSAELLAWSAAEGRFARVDDATQHVNPAIRSLACAAKLLLIRDGTSLDPAKVDRAAMLDSLVAAGVLTDADKASLYVLATVTRKKYPVRIGPHHVAYARVLP